MFYLFLLLTVKSVFGQGGPIIDTEYGQVQGTTIELHNGISVNSFYGIPFAEPPVGPLRFLDPIKLQNPWDDVRQAVELPASCMQRPGGTFTLTHPLWRNFDEDCLTLNVFTPDNLEGESYPVMVWLHGGAYQGSANIQYPGHFLAMKDVVIVVPNYRLGHLGFAFTGDENAPGNAGMKDQVMALQWVQDNIANFGGNPNEVTIFGQSAGAGSCGLMLMSPMATDLFHRVILESGSEMAIWAVNVPDSQPENYIMSVAEQQNCPTDDNAVMMDCLREVSADDIIDTGFNCTEGYFCLGMVPVVDGPGGFLPDTPRNLRLSDNYNKVPEMSMHTTEDGMIYALAFVNADGNWNMSVGFTRDEFNDILQWAVSVFLPSLPDQSREEDLFQAMSWFYSPWPYINDPAMNRHEIGMVVTDVGFGMTGDLQAKDHSEDAPTYYMIFGYRSDGFYDNIIPEWLGVFHMMELPYVLGLPYLPFNDDVRNNSGIRVDPIDYNGEDREYFEFISDLWTNFAKTGNPTPYPVSAPGDKGEVTWDSLTRENLNYMYVDNDFIEVRRNYRQQEFAFWREYLRCMVLEDLDVPGADTTCESPVGVPVREKSGQKAVYQRRNPFEIHDQMSAIMKEYFASDEDNYDF